MTILLKCSTRRSIWICLVSMNSLVFGLQSLGQSTSSNDVKSLQAEYLVLPNIDFPATYARYWESLLDSEYQSLSTELREQRKNWPRHKLEQNGISVFGAIAEPDTEIFGEKVVRIIRPHKKISFREKFTRGDVLLLTPNIPGVDPIPRECLVMDVGKDWMSVGIGSSWLPKLWESRKVVGFYEVRLDRMAPQAPLKAQKIALRQVRDRAAGPCADILAKVFNNSTLAEALSGEPIDGNDVKREEQIRAALEEAKGHTSFKPNASQEEAIIWSLKRKISLLRGPPGTGKTRLAGILISTALNLAALGDERNGREDDAQRVLAVAHSNGAADVLLESLLQMGVPAVRLGRPVSVIPKLRHRTAVAMAGRVPQIQELNKIMGDVDLDHNHRSAAAFEFRQNLLDMQNLIIRAAPVVVTSCIGAHQLLASADSDMKSGEKSRYSLVVLDEASQTTEPALLCALAAAKAKQVVMVGDTKQLPPTVTHMELRETLGLSPMARLEKAGVDIFTLKTQYRMPPSLLLHPSNYFYNGMVKCAEDTVTEAGERCPPAGFPWPCSKTPLAFVDSGRNNEDTHSFGGKSNLQEASCVTMILDQIVKNGDFSANEISVITPYSKQVQLIRSEVSNRDFNNTIGAVRIGTIDSFQGQETDLVIISAVRSNSIQELGFLRDPRRLCVAITRARRGLIILGDRSVLTTSRHWNALIESCDDRKCSTSYEDVLEKYRVHDKSSTMSTKNDEQSLFDDDNNEFYGLFSTIE